MSKSTTGLTNDMGKSTIVLIPPEGFFNNDNLLNLKLSMSLITYLQDTQTELRHVSWPTRSQAIAFTIVVILISLFVSFFLGIFDFFLKEFVAMVVDKFGK